MTSPITDSKKYTSKWLDYISTDGTKHRQVTFTIPGISGKQIKIDTISMNLWTENSGSKASAWITSEVSGIEGKLGECTSTSTKSTTEKLIESTFTGAEGKDVIIRFYLKTSNAAYKALIQNCKCYYSLLSDDSTDDDTTTPVSPEWLLSITFTSETEAKEYANKLLTTTEGVRIFLEHVKT